MASTDDNDGDGQSDADDPHGTRRNVVLVVLDTARAASVDRRTMPTLAALAAEGTTFERAFAAAPWTLPSHASLFTGTYPSEHGAHGGHTYLEDASRTLPEAFGDAGYETIGVSNNTWITEEFGFDRGFDEFRRGWQYVQSDVDMGAVVRAKHLRAKLEAARDRLFEGNPVVNAANLLYAEVLRPDGDDGADRSTSWLVDWLGERDDERPFFCFCNYLEAHVEYRPPREYAEGFLPAGASYDDATAIRQAPRAYDVGEYELTDREFDLLRALYRGELAYVDDQLAQLRRGLEATGEWENTIVVVCGDHGENVGEHGFFGHQYNLYDTLLQVPLVICGGAFSDGDSATGAGDRTDLVQLIDLPDTLLDAAGVADPELREQSRGRSLHPDASSEPRDEVVAEYVAPQPSIERLEDRFDEVPDRVRAYDRQLRAIRTDEYKYVSGDDGFERLHRLDDDPNERTDVSAERPERARALRNRLEAVFDDVEVAESSASVSMSAGTRERLADLGYL